MKTTHDELRSRIEKRTDAIPPATTTEAGKKATFSELADPKKVSAGPFRLKVENRKTQDQPGMPGLSFIPGGMSRSNHTITGTIQRPAADRLPNQKPLSGEDRELFLGLISWLREDTITALKHLIIYDAGISIAGADQLAAALVAIEQADKPNLPGVCLKHDIRLEAANLLTAIFEHDEYLDPFERSDIERTICLLDRAAARERQREGEQ